MLEDKDKFKNEEVKSGISHVQKQVLYMNNLLDNMNELFFTYDVQGTISFVNKKAFDLLGYLPQDALGKKVWEFVPARYRDRFKKELKVRQQTGVVDSYWVTVLHKDGSERIFRLNAAPIIENGSILGEMVLAEDITERRRAEKALMKSNKSLEEIHQELMAANEQLMATEEELRQQLEESEKNKDALADAHHRLEAVLDFLPDPTFVIDNNGKVTIWNRAMEKLTGIKAREMLGKDNYEYAIPFYGKRRPILIDLVINKDLDWERGYIAFSRQKETLFAESFSPQLRVNGAHLSCKASLLYDHRHCVVGAIETIRDITHSKQAEKALQESEEKYRNIIESIEDGYFEVDLSGNFTFFNAFLIRKMGYTADEFRGINYRKVMNEENAEKVATAFNMVYRTGKPVRELGWYVTTQNGTGLYVESTVLPIIDDTDIVGFRGIIRDVTYRKKAEEALQRSEKNLRKQVKYLNTLINNMNELFFTYDLQGRMTFVNKRANEVVGYRPDEMLGRHVSEFVLDEYRQKVFSGIQTRLEKGQDGSYELPLLHKDGKERIIRLNAAPIIEEDGSITGGMVLAEDITKTKKAQEELRISEAKYRAIVEDQTELIVRLLPNLCFDFINEAFCRYYRKNREAIYGVKFTELVLDKDREYVAQCFAALNIVKSVCTVENRVIMPDGEIRWQQWTHRAIFDNFGKLIGYQSVGRDITERKQVEAKLSYLSRHDSLTGLYNRFHFEEQMKLLQIGNYDPVGLIMCDVNGLKLVNDTLGHDKGDQLLKAAAQAISRCFRKEDTVARVGGDEFAILLPRSNRVVVEKAISRLRTSINKYNENGTKLPLSISIGYAVRYDNNIHIMDLFKEADNSMYREKLHSGQSARSSIVQTLIKALEARDFITEGHGDRMQDLVVDMAASLELSEQSLNDLRLLAQFHDIGKVGVPDSILFKAGPLTPEEYSIMKRHSEIGHRIALAAPELVFIADWILKHHEWWNGKGYPLGLKGNEIPLECRILAIADAFDSMTNDRPYRKAMSVCEAVNELRRYAGIQFDPYLVEEFILVLKKHNYGV